MIMILIIISEVCDCKRSVSELTFLNLSIHSNCAFFVINFFNILYNFAHR